MGFFATAAWHSDYLQICFFILRSLSIAWISFYLLRAFPKSWIQRGLSKVPALREAVSAALERPGMINSPVTPGDLRRVTTPDKEAVSAVPTKTI